MHGDDLSEKFPTGLDRLGAPECAVYQHLQINPVLHVADVPGRQCGAEPTCCVYTCRGVLQMPHPEGFTPVPLCRAKAQIAVSGASHRAITLARSEGVAVRQSMVGA